MLGKAPAVLTNLPHDQKLPPSIVIDIPESPVGSPLLWRNPSTLCPKEVLGMKSFHGHMVDVAWLKITCCEIWYP